MRYESINDLPLHCRVNLPEPALHVYRDAWNRAWDESRDTSVARARAWDAVRHQFVKDSLSGRWSPRAA